MFVLKYLAALAAFSVSAVLAAANSHQTVSDINAINERVMTVRRNLESYNGGIPASFRVAKSLYEAHATTETARKNLGSADPFSDEDGQAAMDAYNEMYPNLLETMRIGKEKAPVFKRAGLGYVAQGMIANLNNERASFHQAMNSQLSEEHSRMVAPSRSNIENAFQEAVDAFQT